MSNKKEIICPNCGEFCSFNIDGYGYTPIHLHCRKDKINIGATSFKKCIELLSSYHEPETFLEFYNNEIQWMYVGGKEVINKERSNLSNTEYNIKYLLEQWQIAQHCDSKKEWERIEKELLVKYNIDMTIDSVCDLYLEKYNLILGDTNNV